MIISENGRIWFGVPNYMGRCGVETVCFMKHKQLLCRKSCSFRKYKWTQLNFSRRKSVFFTQKNGDELESLNSRLSDWLTLFRFKCAICVDVLKYLPSTCVEWSDKTEWVYFSEPNCSIQPNYNGGWMCFVLCMHSLSLLLARSMFRKNWNFPPWLSVGTKWNFVRMLRACVRA